MVQVAIAYIALGIGVPPIVAGTLALTAGGRDAMLSPHRRRIATGGVAGMVVFLIAAVMWLRDSVRLR